MDDQQRLEDEVPGPSAQHTPVVLRRNKPQKYPFGHPGKPELWPWLKLPASPDSPGVTEEGITYKRKHHFRSHKILSLNTSNFVDYIASKEKALVLFYDSRKEEQPLLENEFSDAADRGGNPKHGFAAVNCFKDFWLCEHENVTQTPMFKLYSNGFNMSNIPYTPEFNANQIQMLMTMTPVLTMPRIVMGVLKQMEAEEECTPPKKKSRCMSCI